MQRAIGATNQSVTIQILNPDGTPKTDVDFETTDLALRYTRDGATVSTITPAELTAVDAAHADGGIIHKHGGSYRLDVPDAAFLTGVLGFEVTGTVPSGIIVPLYVELTALNRQDGVRGGMTALPNAAADAAGGLPISDAGGLDLDARLDAAVGSRLASGAYTAPDNSTITAIAGYLDTEMAAVLALLQRGEAGSGTLAAIAAGTVTLEAGGHGINLDARLLIVLTSGTAAKGKVRALVYSGSGDVWNVDRDWDADGETIPSGTITYSLLAVPLDKMIEEDSGLPRFTAAALAQAPSGTGASATSIREEMDSNSTRLASIEADTQDLQTQIGVDGAGLTAIGDARLVNLDAAVSSRAATGAAMTLTAGERTAVANEVEAQIIDEADAEQVLAAITAKIAEANPDLSGLTLEAIGVSVRTALAVELARIDVAIGTRLASAGYTAPPAAATNAGAVRTELQVELARIDATVSSRATAADVPTAVQNADALLARNQKGGSTGPSEQSVAAALAGGGANFTIVDGVLTVNNLDGTPSGIARTLTRAQLNAIISSIAA